MSAFSTAQRSSVARARLLADSTVVFLQWDGVENKTSVAIYAGGAVVLLWFSSTIVSAVNSVPLVRVRFACGQMIFEPVYLIRWYEGIFRFPHNA